MTARTPPVSPIGDGSSRRDLAMPRRAFQTAAATARAARQALRHVSWPACPNRRSCKRYADRKLIAIGRLCRLRRAGREPFSFVRPNTSFVTTILLCRHFAGDVWATGLGHEALGRVCTDNITCRFAGTSGNGSDGTRTRDLRRDRPVMVAPGLAAISGDLMAIAGLFDADVAGIRGCRRELPGTSCGMGGG